MSALNRMRMRRSLGVACLIAALAATGCGASQPSSTSNGGDTPRVTRTAQSSTVAIKRAPESFAGNWGVHDGQLSIWSAGKVGHKTFWFGQNIDADQPGTQVNLLRLSLSPSRTRMRVTIWGVGYVNQHGISARLPNPTDNFVPGDTFVLVFVAPHLLKAISIHTRYHGVEFGNPYWCGIGLAAKYQHLCGA